MYFLLPLFAALRFAGISAFGSVISESGFTSSLALSVRLAVITTLITIALMLPTAVYVHLRLPKLRRLLEGITILPIVIPPVVLIVGVLQIAPASSRARRTCSALEYVVLAMPFAYRAIDAGLRALDLKTIVEASNSLGAGWISTLWRVILPNLRTALLSAIVLTVALVLGEFTMASLDLYQTFPVWIYVNSQTSGQVSVAASLLALFVPGSSCMAITVIGTRQSRKSGGGAVTLFTVARQRNAGRLMTTNTARNAAVGGTAPGRPTRRRHERAAAGPDPRRSAPPGPWTGCRSRWRPASSSRCSGPSGCGKTTALRIVAGFETADTGSVLIDGKDISSVPAARRDMGMVFQSYSLFPNMSALDNVAFGLRMRKIGAAERRKRAGDLLDMVGLAPQARQYPHQLSGGQQQRVALARALAIEPRVLLLDEPLSALDAKVRLQLREQIRTLQQRLGTTTLFVTHDQEEALSMADRVGVMQQGRLEQIAAPDELYADPATAFVAEFVGIMNRMPGELQAGGLVTVLGQHGAGPRPRPTRSTERRWTCWCARKG